MAAYSPVGLVVSDQVVEADGQVSERVEGHFIVLKSQLCEHLRVMTLVENSLQYQLIPSTSCCQCAKLKGVPSSTPFSLMVSSCSLVSLLSRV